MRTAGILFRRCFVLGLCLVLATGCKSKGSEAAPPDPAALKAQQELMARRDQLMAQRAKLEGESTKLGEEIKKVEASGGDTKELVARKQEIDTQLQQETTKLDTTSNELSAISSKLDAAAGIAAREARVAQREADVAKREREAMTKMQELVALESKNAEKWKEGCTTGAQPMIIQQVAPPKSADGKYTRKEVDGLVAKAKGAMSKKGLISADLGGIDSEVTKALSESDWTRAYILATQWAQTVEQTQINRAFIGAKYQRLQNRVKGATLDESTQAALTEGMKEVLQKYGDGDHSAANKRINQLWNQVK